MRRAALMLIIGCTAGDDVPAPVITSISPNHASVGTTVTIDGDYFCQEPETDESEPVACPSPGIVTFGQSPATVGMYSEHRITVEVPTLEPAKKYDVTVAVAGRHSSPASFTVER
jgi:hypothetical protein